MFIKHACISQKVSPFRILCRGVKLYMFFILSAVLSLQWYISSYTNGERPVITWILSSECYLLYGKLCHVHSQRTIMTFARSRWLRYIKTESNAIGSYVECYWKKNRSDLIDIITWLCRCVLGNGKWLTKNSFCREYQIAQHIGRPKRKIDFSEYIKRVKQETIGK